MQLTSSHLQPHTDKTAANSSVAGAQIKQQWVDECGAKLISCYNEWFSKTDKHLSMLASQSAEHRPYLEAKQTLHRQRRLQEQDFQFRTTASFNHYFSKEFYCAEAETALHFEDNPALKVLKKIESRFPASLAQLNASLNRIALQKNTENTLPIGPTQVLGNFYASLLGFGFSETLHAEIVELFEQPFLTTLQALLEFSKSLLATENSNNTAALTTLNIGQSQPKLSTLQALLTRLPRQALCGSENAEKKPTRTLSKAELIRQVSHYQYLQWQALSGNALLETTLSLSDFKHWLRYTLTTEEKKLGPTQLSRADDDIITLIAMLFEALEVNSGTATFVPRPLAITINRLQIPILKAALLEPSFFSDPKHPARSCLDTFIQSTIGWQQTNTAPNQDSLYSTLNESVITLLREFKNDTALFSQQQTIFEKMRAQEDKKREIVSARSLETERGTLKNAKARKVVDIIIKKRVADTQLSDLCYLLVEGPWRKYLIRTYLVEGSSSEAWAEALITTDQLIACLQSKGGVTETNRWTQLAPGLMRRLNAGLEDTHHPQNEINHINKAMWLYQIEHLKLQPSELRRVTLKTKPVPLNKTWFNYALKLSQSGQQPLPANDLATGRWVKIELGNTATYAQIAGTIADINGYLLVSAKGFKVASLSGKQIQTLLNEKKLSVIDPTRWVEHSFRSAMRKMSGLAHNTSRQAQDTSGLLINTQ